MLSTWPDAPAVSTDCPQTVHRVELGNASSSVSAVTIWSVGVEVVLTLRMSRSPH